MSEKVALLSDEHKELHTRALIALTDAGVDFMLGGAFAVYYYTNWWRDTHDIDMYIVHEDLDRATEALEKAGYHDLGEQAKGDREWIYHAGRESMIVDLIWRFANLANYVTRDWLDRAPKGRFLGVDVKFLPLEEVVWIKTFVINRDRCDWPDVMRVIKSQCRNLDWNRLLGLLAEHWLLLAGMIDVFDWQHPELIDCVPESVREELMFRRRDYWKHPPQVDREQLLDPWLDQRADRYAVWRDE